MPPRAGAGLLVWLLLQERFAGRPLVGRRWSDPDLPMPAPITTTTTTRARPFDARRALPPPAGRPRGRRRVCTPAGDAGRRPRPRPGAGTGDERPAGEGPVVHGEDPRFPDPQRAGSADPDRAHLLGAAARSGGVLLGRRSARRPRLVRRPASDAGVTGGQGVGAGQGRCDHRRHARPSRRTLRAADADG